VQGAEPGDMIEVIFHDVAFHPDAPWGFSGIFERENGGGAQPQDAPRAHGMAADTCLRFRPLCRPRGL